MNTGKNRVKGLKAELFKKKYQTNPVVSNPTDELRGQNLSGMVIDYTKKFEDDLARDRAYRQVNPLRSPYTRQYTPQEIAKMKRNFPMTAEDFQISNSYGIAGLPDLTEGQGVNDIRTLNQIQGQTEVTTSTPASLQNFQNPEFVQRVEDAVDRTLPEDKNRSQLKKAYDSDDWRNAVRMGVGVTSAARGVYNDTQVRENLSERIQNLNDRPRYMPNEYEFMGRPGSQSVIYAKHGAQIRTGTESGAEEAELERGEMFMLPNLDTYQVGGKKHSQGGEDFVLPEGTIVFSDYLKVPGVGKTFSDQAKKFDITKYKEILENPHAKSVDRTTAEIMMDRNMKKLQELFQIQQSMNGDSTGEVKSNELKQGQLGLKNLNSMIPITPEQKGVSLGGLNMFGKTAPAPLTPQAKDQFYAQQPGFTAPVAANKTTPKTQAQKKQEGLAEATAIAADNEDKLTTFIASQAAKVSPYNSGTLGATKQPTPNTATNITKTEPRANEIGTVTDANAADSSSMHYKTAANGKRVYVEGQGSNKGKSYRDQYGNNPFLLVRNRLNEHYGQLNPLLLSAYQLQLKDKNLMVKSGEDLVDIMEGGNNTLVAMRNFYKSTNNEALLFDPALDKGGDDNMKQAKTAKLFKDYIESPQFVADVAEGKVSANIPWLRNQPTAIKDAEGKVTGYKLDTAEVNSKYIQQYQAAYKAFGGVKAKMPKDNDLLKGYRVAPEGLADHTWMGYPISPVDEWGGNTTIGQLSAFEDEEAIKKQTPTQEDIKATDAGKNYNTEITPATMGKFNKEGFDFPQLAPEMYGLAASEMFAYAPMDYNAPYVMPQTLNIQPQLQDVDNSYMAALNAGADPNSALIATLGAKQRVFSEKQNFDAQQRAQADQVNAQSRWQEDVYDMQSLDNVYNTLIADADDAVTAQKQALIQSANNKRASWKMEETRKEFWYNNFVRSFDYDPNTRSLVVKKDANKEVINQLNTNYGTNIQIPEIGTQTQQTTTTAQ